MSEGGQGVIKSIDVVTIVKKFLVRGFNISPEAAKLLCSFEDPDDIIDEVCKNAKGKFIIAKEDVLSAFNTLRARHAPRTEVKSQPTVETLQRVRVLKDVRSSIVEGKVEDFTAYFNSRLEKISKILRTRIQATQIRNVGRFKGETVSVVGIVSNVFQRKDHFIIELEDQTGTINCIATGKNAEIAAELLGDEVIGVTGTLKGSSIVADRIVFPDIPLNGEKRKEIDFGAVFISDTHFGSRDFLEKSWERFVEWLNCESSDEKLNRAAEKVKYVILAGDVVDGVGVYPDQEKELAIIDIYQQYEFAAEKLDGIRKDLEIIVAPGNHDAVRQAEPQPPLPKEFESLFPKNVTCVGNPAYLDLNGLKVLVYHGRSLDDIITKIPRLSYDAPHKGMEELLKRRHLSPLYGGRSPIAPDREDHLVIEEIPDVIHSGHVHTFGVGFYRGVFLVNSSTWQSQTEFQKKVNLNPMPAKVAVYLGDKIGKLDFGGG